MPPEADPPPPNQPEAIVPVVDPSREKPRSPVPPPLIDPFLALQPGENDSVGDGSRRLRWPLVALLATVTLAAVGAGGYIVGRGSPTESPPADSRTAPASLAALANEHLRATTITLAEACGLPDAVGPAREILARALRRCWGRAAPLGPRQPPLPAASPRVASGKQVREGERMEEPAGVADPPQSIDRSARCLARCERAQERCNREECGEEPTSGRQYEDYQRCLGRCLREASSCRLECR